MSTISTQIHRLCFVLAALLVSSVVQAHTIRPAVITMTLEQGGEVAIQVRSNAELYLAGIPPDYTDTNDAPNAAEYDRLRAAPVAAVVEAYEEFGPEFAGNIGLLVDGQRVPLRYAGINIEPQPDAELSRDAYILLAATLPPDSAQLVWDWPEEYGSNVLRIQRAGEADMVSVWLKPGELSRPYNLGGSATEVGRWQIAANYVVIGFEHIVPKGLDHILFVLGIFLLSVHWRPLLWQVTAFTVAHTITLGLSIYGIVSAPSTVVEPLIALSIAYVGIENIITPQLKPWRIVLVFMFGLLHGLGFAGVLSEIGLPESEFLTALITFNIGVELGQLSVILGAFLLVGWWRDAPWYRARIVIPASLAISAISLYWTWERIFG